MIVRRKLLAPVLNLGLGLLLAACGSDGGDDGPNPTPTPTGAQTRVQVLRDGGAPRISVTVDGVGGPTFLVGQRAALSYGGEAQIAKIDINSCSVTARWSSLEAYLDAAKANRITLIHVEPWSVWDSTAPYPFLKDASGRFRVQAAVENNEWNVDYFRNIRNLVDGASRRGIVVLFTLFNHYNMRFENGPEGRPWKKEPLRAANSDTNFGVQDFGTDWKLRTEQFVTIRDGAGNLTTVARIQKALIERILDEVNQDNLILEPLMVPWIYNNPSVTGLELAAWENWIVSVIRAKEAALARGHRAIIEITPAPTESLEPIVRGGVNKVFDSGEWRDAFASNRPGYENWSQVDIITYAGMFAFGDPPFGEDAEIYAHERMLNHRRQFPDKVMVYSTDGFNQRYAPNKCTAALGEYVQDVRHGWWDVLDAGHDLSQFPLAWVNSSHDLIPEVPLGNVHFLNWTTAQTSMEDLARRSF